MLNTVKIFYIREKNVFHVSSACLVYTSRTVLVSVYLACCRLVGALSDQRIYWRYVLDKNMRI